MWAQAQFLEDRCPPENAGTRLGNFCGVTRPQINPRALKLLQPKEGPLGSGPRHTSKETGYELVGGKSRRWWFLRLLSLQHFIKINTLTGESMFSIETVAMNWVL